MTGSPWFDRSLYAVLLATAAVFLCLFMWGCGVPDQPRGEAVTAVWRGVYGARQDPPGMLWVEGPSLDCDAGLGFQVQQWPGGPEWPGGDCVWGSFWPSWWLAQVADPASRLPSQGALAHELWHARLQLRDGDPDPGHLDPGFGVAYGHAPGIVDEARAALRAEGM